MGKTAFRIEIYEHGLAVLGACPVTAMTGIARIARDYGWTRLSPGIATVLGASLVFVSKKSGESWALEVNESAAKSGVSAEMAWLMGTDTGSSSVAMFAALAPEERDAKAAEHRMESRDGWGSYPVDPADLGRCIRLLDKFPEWRNRLRDVAERYEDIPAWPALIEHWDELEVAYHEELKKGQRAPKCYDLMQKVIDDANRSAKLRA